LSVGGNLFVQCGRFNVTGITVRQRSSRDCCLYSDNFQYGSSGNHHYQYRNHYDTQGTGATPSAPVVTVAGTTTGTGTKLLYLYDGTSSPAWKLSRTPNTTSSNYATINTSTSRTWSMNPSAASDIIISSAVNATIPVTLYMARNSAGQTKNIEVDLQCSSGGTILTQTQSVNLTGTITAYTFNLPLTGTLTCGRGNSWNLKVSQTSGNDSTRVYPQSGGSPSYIRLPATTVVNVNSIQFYSGAIPEAVSFRPYRPEVPFTFGRW